MLPKVIQFFRNSSGDSIDRRLMGFDASSTASPSRATNCDPKRKMVDGRNKSDAY